MAFNAVPHDRSEAVPFDFLIIILILDIPDVFVSLCCSLIRLVATLASVKGKVSDISPLLLHVLLKVIIYLWYEKELPDMHVTQQYFGI